MTILDEIKLRALLKQAVEQTKHVEDAVSYTRSYHQDTWLAVRIMCEAMLEPKDDGSFL